MKTGPWRHTNAGPNWQCPHCRTKYYEALDAATECARAGAPAQVPEGVPVLVLSGTTHGYHVNTLGFLAGEIVRRVSGESIGAFFRREVAEPLELDFHFGVPAADDARVAEYAFGADSSAEEAQVFTDMKAFPGRQTKPSANSPTTPSAIAV